MTAFTLILAREFGNNQAAAEYAIKREAALLQAGFVVEANRYRQAVRELVSQPQAH